MLELVLLLLLLGASAFFSGSETALFALSDVELGQFERQGGRQRQAVELARRPQRTLVTILLLNMIANVGLSVILTSLCLDWFGPAGLVVAIPAATVMLLLFGEIVPKSYGIRRRRVIAPAAAPALTFLAWLLGPLQRGLEAMARAITGGASSSPLSLDELYTLVAVARDDGELTRFESRVLSQVLDFADTPIERCMTPRVEMVTVEEDAELETAIEIFQRTGRSRLPVVGEGLDDVRGVLMVKDVLTREEELTGRRVAELMRPVGFEPETLGAGELFRRFQQSRTHLAIVVGEHGGVEGVVTLEDLLEELIGDVRDESDEVARNLESLGPGICRGDASVEISELLEAMDLPEPEEELEAVTVSGLLQDELGRVPRRGDEIHWNGLRIRVLTASPNRARLVRFQREERPT